MKEQYGRDFTAQPYGINTVGAFPFIFDIMLPIAAPWGANLGLETAWKVGCASNFIVGIINVVLGCLFLFKPVGDFILMYVPVASFCIPVAGVGLTWLALNQIAPNFASPIAGFIPVFMVFVMYWSGPNGSPIKISGIKFPNVLHWIIPGLILGLIFKLAPVMEPGYAYNYPGGGIYIGGDCFEGLSKVGSYFGIILPLAFVATMGDIMSLVTAFNAGDPYPIAETLIVDGLFTMVGAILGSPFGTVVYFGHPVHKKLGGKYAYSFLNGVIYLILCISGVFGILVDISPKVMVGPTIMVFGVYLDQVLQIHATPSPRHHLLHPLLRLLRLLCHRPRRRGDYGRGYWSQRHEAWRSPKLHALVGHALVRDGLPLDPRRRLRGCRRCLLLLRHYPPELDQPRDSHDWHDGGPLLRHHGRSDDR